jgi:hypothetical protein
LGKNDPIDWPSAAFNATSLFEADRDEGHQARVTRLRSWFSGLGRARIFVPRILIHDPGFPVAG